MRITNSMITLNSQNNINGTKFSVDQLNTQMSTQKKIQNPSEDPVIAIRSLRFRNTLSKIDQYYDRNIPDAQSWLDLTETVLNNVKGLVTDVYNQCLYGATDELKDDDRSTILKNLNELRSQIYAEGNADNAGRTILTGFKTNKKLTFEETNENISYDILQHFENYDVDSVKYIKNKKEVVYGDIANVPADELPEEIEVNRIRLGYTNLTPNPDESGNIKLTYMKDGLRQSMDVTVKSSGDGDAVYEPADDEVYFIPETGELVLGENANTILRGDIKDIQFSYTKTGFQKGELMPEHFYDCTQTVDENGLPTMIAYKKEPNDIEYTVSFNQSLKINTEASEVMSTDMVRDIDDLISALDTSMKASDKIKSIEQMMADDRFQSDADQENLKTMLEAANKEKDLADDYVQKLFGKNVTIWQGNLDTLNLAITDCGSRASRANLTLSRVGSQKTTYEELQMSNEERDISDIIIDYTAAYNAYTASLTAASKASQQTLLNFI